MAKKYINWKTKGMNRDMSVSAFNPEFAFENVNLRLATNDGNTMMSWVTEKGTDKCSVSFSYPIGSSKPETTIMGTVIGTAILNEYLVLFTVGGGVSRIYRMVPNPSSNVCLGTILYKGNLGFSTSYPIETLVSYESKDIQKVYWTDNLNQPRVINISPTMDDKLSKYNDHSFDFVQELQLNESVKVSKIFGSGEFPPGVIQYAFTYYNKYGQESNVFYTTPLQYISYVDRGGSPEGKIANSFRITVTGVDRNFEYMRIYSILRTSRDATPLVKRIQDIEINGSTTLSYMDNGLSGETVDPTELLYKGGDEIKAKTLEQKDGTLFLGNFSVTRPQLSIKDTIKTSNGVTDSNPLANGNVVARTVAREYPIVSYRPFLYVNTLNGDQGASCFKSREYYRLGVQFQYKNGKWSEPCWIGDKQCNVLPSMDENNTPRILNVPEFRYTLQGVFKTLYSQGYRRVRPLFMVPGSQDRTIVCQGIGAPTLYRNADRGNNLYGIASWLFRTPVGSRNDWNTAVGSNVRSWDGGGYVSYYSKLKSQYETPFMASGSTMTTVSPYLSSTEVMGTYDDDHTFCVDPNLITLNSPDITFDDAIAHMDFQGCGMSTVGYTTFKETYGDIDIQVSTPPIGSDSSGFVHRSITTAGAAALVSGLFFNDYLVDDLDNNRYDAYYSSTNPAVDYPVYMWHKNGSLNNDVSRDSRSAVLLKKRISNYRLGGNTVYAAMNQSPKLGIDSSYPDSIQLFSNDYLSIIKVQGNTYQGNVDTMVVPTTPSPYYFVGDPWRDKVDTTTRSRSYYRLGLEDPTKTTSKSGIWKLTNDGGTWAFRQNDKKDSNIGDKVKGLAQWREGVSIKYKSTPHLVAKIVNNVFTWTDGGTLGEGQAPIMEVYREYDKATMFGGTSEEALQAATWIPCGPPVSFTASTDSLNVDFRWGDTYFQRFECLKTYPYTQEDKNQVVEIASFMVETRVNIDGRYDRNRAQTNNLNMTPQNFNLINPVYSQMDNFFSYKMLDKDSYMNLDYPNSITWTKTKQSGADTDLWTNITLANVLEMDGDKGAVNEITRLNNQLLSFQDRGIAQVLYNENTQISTTEGVPIEIANSNKVQGKRYYSDTVGCSNRWSMATTPSGIYFMDSNERSIYLFNGQLNNISTTGGFNSWAKQNIPSINPEWNPETLESFVTYYDKQNQDVLFISKQRALAYSEKFGCFTSFYDYGGAAYFINLRGGGFWIRGGELWRHQASSYYCKFFGTDKPYSMTLIANQEPQLDKMFTNLEFRAGIDGEGDYNSSNGKFTPWLPFNTLEAWDEYQHGMSNLSISNGHSKFIHATKDGNGPLDRKFRIWRCDIPRDNATVDAATEGAMGIKRFKARPLDRMRNPWIYLKLQKNADASLARREIHDIMVTYFG